MTTHFRDSRRAVGARYGKPALGVQMPVVCADDFVTLSDTQHVTTKLDKITCVNCAIVATGKVARYRPQMG